MNSKKKIFDNVREKENKSKDPHAVNQMKRKKKESLD